MGVPKWQQCPETNGKRHNWQLPKGWRGGDGVSFVCELCGAMSRRPRTKRGGKIRTLLKRDGYNCWLCGEPFTKHRIPTLDHIIPKVAGGADANENLRLACALCNWGRGALEQDPRIDGRTGESHLAPRKRRRADRPVFAVLPVEENEDE